MSPLDGYSWVQALGWSLVHFLWQGALVGLCFALARASIPKENAALRYASGLCALAVLALCPLVTLWILRPQAVAAGADGVALAGALVSASGVVANDVAGIGNLLPPLVALWIAGVIIMFARAVVQWRALDRIASRLAWAQADIDDLLQTVAARFGSLARVRVLVSRHIDTPTLLGWFNPVILLPAAVVLGFPRQQLELILAHELGHLRRHDHLVNLAQAVVENLLFYHPVVHWISREVRHEREVCCDNLVLRLTEHEPREYARTLAALEDLRQLSPQLAVAATGGMLLDRVRRIIGSAPASTRQPRRRPLLGAGLLAMVAAGGLTSAIFVSRDDSPPAGSAIADIGLSAVPRADLRFDLDLPLDATFRPHWSKLPRLHADERVAPSPQVAPIVAPPAARADSVLPIALPPPAAIALQDDRDAALTISDVAHADVVTAPLQLEAPAARARSMPTLVRRVDPVYPDINMTGSRGHVEFEFAIDGDGHVRDINVVSGDSLGAFAVAARRALRQWRFAPYRAQAHAGERFRQDFVFVGVTPKAVVSDDPICLRGTGSHLCRPARDAGVTTEIDRIESGGAVHTMATVAERSPAVRGEIAAPAVADVAIPGSRGGTH